MASKDDILQSIKTHKNANVPDLPELNIDAITYDDVYAQYGEALKSVGGEAILLDSISDLEGKIRELYPEITKVVCNIDDCPLTTDNGNSVKTPHELASVELAIIKGEFAVAENGAVWVKNPDNRHRALYFLAENIVIVVDKNSVVSTMHDAYERVSFEEAGYGTFVSGPSKTADIEQSLVIGAHGPKSGFVFLV